MSLLLRGYLDLSFAILHALDVSSRIEDRIASESMKTMIRELLKLLPRSTSISSCTPITMVPCECGVPFDDLTDWKTHSTATGHCCIYKCRKPASAYITPGISFDRLESLILPRNYNESWNAHPTFQVSPSEDFHPPPYHNWRNLQSRYELPHTRDPAAPVLQLPPKGRSSPAA